MFKSAGLLAAAQKNMDACMKSHVALVAPGACAIYMRQGYSSPRTHARVSDPFDSCRLRGIPCHAHAWCACNALCDEDPGMDSDHDLYLSAFPIRHQYSGCRDGAPIRILHEMR